MAPKQLTERKLNQQRSESSSDIKELTDSTYHLPDSEYLKRESGVKWEWGKEEKNKESNM
jgi:hypothetical protein